MDFVSADPDPKEILTDPQYWYYNQFIRVLDINSVAYPSALPRTRFLCSLLVLDKYLMFFDITTLYQHSVYVHVAA
jgi:hypothetical protein